MKEYHHITSLADGVSDWISVYGGAKDSLEEVPCASCDTTSSEFFIGLYFNEKSVKLTHFENYLCFIILQVFLFKKNLK